MATRNDIDSTEKLLNLIRKGPSQSVTEGHAPRRSASPLWTSLRNRVLPFRSTKVMGLEILRDSLHLALSEQTRSGWRLLHASSVDIPADMTVDTPEFKDFLQNQLQDLDPRKTAEVWFALPASRGEIWSIRVPRVKKGMANVVYWSARKEKNFDPKQHIFNFRLGREVDEGGVRKIQAEICLAPAEDIQKYRQLITDTGYRLRGITLPAASLDNLFQHARDDYLDKPYAILYIGEDSSCIKFYSAGTVLFSRVIRMGQDSFLDSINMEHSRQDQEGHDLSDLQVSSSTNLLEESSGSREKALQILKQLQHDGRKSSEDDDKSPSSALDLIYPALERLSRQLERTIDQLVKVMDHPAPEELFICGKIAFLQGIADFFSQNLDIPAQILDVPSSPNVQVENTITEMEPDERLSLVSTVGLTMPWSGTVNFLHTAMDKEREAAAMRNTNLVAAGCALAFVVVAGYWAWMGHQLEQAREETRSLQDQLSEYSPRLTRDMLQDLVEEHQDFKDTVINRAQRLQAVALIGEIGRITPDDFRLLEMILELDSQTDEDERRQNLIVEGFIRGEGDNFETRMTSYLVDLRNSPLFRSAHIHRSSRGTLEEEGEVFRFVLNIDPERI